MENRNKEIALQIYIGILSCMIGIFCRCYMIPIILGLVAIYKIMEYMIDVDDC